MVLTVGCTVIPGTPGAIAPLAIGASLRVMIFAGGHISGGAFNPAVAVGIGIMHLVRVSDLWIHFVADLAGGLAAGCVFKLLNPEDK